MANNHRAHVYYTLEEWLKDYPGHKRAKRIALWKKHIAKHGNVPLVIKCAICSGQEEKRNRKRGIWRMPRPVKSVRDESLDWFF